MGAWVVLSGPGAGLKSVGLISGPWMIAVGPGGSRSAMGPDAMVHRAAGLRGLVRNPAGRALESCFCRASLVWGGEEQRLRSSRTGEKLTAAVQLEKKEQCCVKNNIRKWGLDTIQLPVLSLFHWHCHWQEARLSQDHVQRQITVHTHTYRQHVDLSINLVCLWVRATWRETQWTCKLRTGSPLAQKSNPQHSRINNCLK